MAGTSSPDCTGDYREAGIYSLEPYYRRTDGAYFIWKHEGYNQYFVSPVKGVYEDSWSTAVGTRLGVCTPHGTYTGSPLMCV